MSVNLNWSSLESDSLSSWTKDVLAGALNSGKRSNVLALDISIKDLNFGKVAPDFEILEIGELEKDRFRGIFKVTYSGDFHLTLHTQVQANQLKIYSDNSQESEISEESFITPRFLLSKDSFNIPLDLKLSDLRFLGIVIVVFSKTKGLTLVFRNDPLDSIKVNSTFDSFQFLAKFLQKQIEKLMRNLFRESLPTLIHQFSLKYTSSFPNNDFMNNLKDHLKDSTPVTAPEVADFESVNPATVRKLAKIYSSRQTLDLHVSRFKRVVQRNHLEKFNKHLSPSLTQCLSSSLQLTASGKSDQQANSIPVEILESGDYWQRDATLREISSIQSKSFYAANCGKAKRRTIKIRKKKTEPVQSETGSAQENGFSVTTSETERIPASNEIENKHKKENLSVISENPGIPTYQPVIRMHHPMPVKRVQVTDRLHCNSHPSPLSHNSSFVGSVGLGNSVFTRPGPAISASPLKKEAMPHTKVEEFFSRFDVEQINHRLQLQLNLLCDKNGKDPIYTEAPPPYYQGTRLGF